MPDSIEPSPLTETSALDIASNPRYVTARGFNTFLGEIQGKLIALGLDAPLWEQTGLDRSGDDYETALESATRTIAILLRQLSAANKRLAEVEWRPIETAPKDGAYILLRNECGSWIGKYCPEYQSGFRPSNPWQSMMLNHDHMGRAWNTVPSEWKPLDAAPKEAE